MQEQLLHAENTSAMLQLLDGYITGLINQSNTNCPLIQSASHLRTQNPSKLVLLQVQRDLHITERTLQRMFDKHIGVSPNQHRRTCRFNAAFTKLNSRKNYKLSDIAFQHGYADQGPYIRAFSEFQLITPNTYGQFGERH